jgi:hypothetical protein
MWAFFYWVAERVALMRTHTVRQICQEQIWTAEGWPWSAQRGRVRPMDGPNNPTLSARRFAALSGPTKIHATRQIRREQIGMLDQTREFR